MPKTIQTIRIATIGNRLRTRRRELGLTQEQLAIKAGTTQHVIQKIENGKSLRPRKIDGISKALGVTSSWLQFGDDAVSAEAMEIAKAWDRMPASDQAKYRSEILNIAEAA